MLVELFLSMSFLGAGEQVVLLHPLEVVAVDGDTLRVGSLRLRLSGIDAPEMAQPGGKLAREHLKQLVATGTLLTCRLWDVDRYKRRIATCYNINGVDLNWRMVEDGYAFAYRQYSLTYVQAEDKAKAARVGVWGGAVEYPWTYRARRKSRN